MSEAVKLRKKHKPNTLNINVHNPDKKIEQDVMSLMNFRSQNITLQ